ncbi:glycoside hydrolase family 65 protein, partial [Candidatus Bipolaricaulota bacterium]|nr:glycoside hydrolase family 65 protein [Candidatus Bipolaricaulota bacterium]
MVNEDLVNFPNWLCLTFRPDDGEWLDLLRMEILSYRQELHLRDGLLIRRFRVRDKQGKETSIVSRRLVHMGNPHLAAIEYSITPENWSGQMRILSTIDGSVTNAGVARYQQLSNKHLRIVQMGSVEREGIYLHVQTTQSRLEVAEAARTQIFCDEQRLAAVVHKV